MNIRELVNQLISDPEFQELHRFLTMESFFGILGINEREVVHTCLLGWLLNPRASHGMGSQPLRQFLLLCSRRLFKEKAAFGDEFRDISFIDPASISATNFDQLKVQTEYPHDFGRCDIFVYSNSISSDETQCKSPFLLIEYKINADEGEDQTERYVEFVNQLLDEQEEQRYPLLVYISPTTDVHAPCQPFISIGFQDLLEWIAMLDRNLTKTQIGQFLVSEYAAVLDLITDRVNNSRFSALKNGLQERYADNGIGPGFEEWEVDDPEAKSVLFEYATTMEAIGIVASCPPTENVVQLASLFRSVLDSTKWEIRGAKLLMIHHLGFRNILISYAKRYTRNPRLQITINATGTVSLQFYWNKNASVQEVHVMELCSSLRMYLQKHPAIHNLLINMRVDSKTIGSIIIDGLGAAEAPGVAQISLGSTIGEVDAILAEWCAGEAPGILATAFPH
jgi:hypothetical protein